jgi:hypothetical protein
MTPLVETFLRDIGEPIALPDEACTARGLPPFRTTIPVFHCVGGFAAVLSPAMCRSPEGLEQLRALPATVRIIFNETNFEIASGVPQGGSAVLIIKPSIPGLYHVWQARGLPGLFSPFGAKQVMTARTIAFGISMLIQLATVDQPARALSQERLNVIAKLCRGDPRKDFGIVAAQVYSQSK